MSENRRKKDSAKLVWDTKPKRAPNPRDIEFQTAEIVIPNPQKAQGNLPLLAVPQSGLTSLFPGQMGELPLGGFDIDKTKMNRLIWGDNLLAMQALLAQGYAGKIDLIYIDPPFLSSADYSFQLSIEGKQVDKEPNIIERLAYTDTWEGGLDSYLDMLYPRLQLIKRLLSNRGSLYAHIDSNMSHYMRILLEETFGIQNITSQIFWKRRTGMVNQSSTFGNCVDAIILASKTGDCIYNRQFTKYDSENYINQKFTHEDGDGRKYRLTGLTNPAYRPTLKYNYKGYESPNNGWSVSLERMEELDKLGKLYFPKDKSKRLMRKDYLDEWEGYQVQNLWADISQINPMSNERVDYPTQKPESLLERIIKASSNEGDLVADFFCGSGTTMAVADRLNRRWIGCNLDKVGIQVSRNRLVNQQSQPFLLENIGNYQRHMIYLSGSKIGEMQRIILKLYGADPRSDRPDLGIRTQEGQEPELAYVGYPDRPVTAKKVIELAQDAQILDGTGYKTLTILAWDYDYNFTTELENRKKAEGDKLKTELKTLTIPPEIYNYLKKAKNEAELDGLRDKIIFHDKPYFKVSQPQIQGAGDGKITIIISIDRYVLMDFPINDEKQKTELRKAIKDNFAALIDYWAIDWDYDGITFKSMWQAIRGNGKRANTVITTASSPQLSAGKRTIAVRLVDVFGNDASATVQVH
ncbi:adenine specific DNA methylase-N end [Microcystis aeruginosa NIES-3787]|uniref:Adenine specific DNA methylase-N end n=3 Tax=Microcystis TaxID=1125 RepID=A0A6H9FXF8_MICAE|nr:adenine specific DNA methylase-N end [Microcystis aeruginosa NIES-3787]